MFAFGIETLDGGGLHAWGRGRGGLAQGRGNWVGWSAPDAAQPFAEAAPFPRGRPAWLHTRAALRTAAGPLRLRAGGPRCFLPSWTQAETSLRQLDSITRYLQKINGFKTMTLGLKNTCKSPKHSRPGSYVATTRAGSRTFLQ